MKKLLGKRGEAVAARFLKRRGLSIVARNWRSPAGEVDIITLDGETLVFVEVKARSGNRFGSAAESVDARKQRRITRAAIHYLSLMNAPEGPPAVRFDVICVSGGLMPKVEEYIPDAFGLDS